MTTRSVDGESEDSNNYTNAGFRRSLKGFRRSFAATDPLLWTMAVERQIATKDRLSQWQSKGGSAHARRGSSGGMVGPENGLPNLADSDMDGSEVASAAGEVKTTKLLSKKIAKTQTMLNDAEANEPKGRDSKLYRRLTEKLEQYEAEIAILVAAEKASQKQAKHDEFPITQLKSPIASKRYLVPPDSPMGSPISSFLRPSVSSKRGSDLSVVSDSMEFESARPSELQKKMKKVQKLMADMVKEQGEKAKEKKLYKRYGEKLVAYESSLTDFEGRMKQQAKEGNIFHAVKPPQLSPKANSKAEVRRARKSCGAEPVDFDEDKLPPKKKKSSRSGPKRKSTRVSAARIQELDKLFKPEVHDKGESSEELIRKEIKTNFIFEKLNKTSVEVLVKAFEATRIYAPGELIVEEGEDSDPIYFYIIGSGRVDYEVNGQKVGTAEAGQSFGEQGLLYSCPRKASVRSTTSTKLFRIDQITFRYVLQNQTKFQVLLKKATRKVIAMNRLLEVSQHKTASEDDSVGDQYDIDKDFQEDMGGGSFNLGTLEDDQEDFVGEVMSQMSSRRMSMQNSFHECRLSLASFNRESVLGEGQFGEVWKVKPNIENLKDQNFALKIQAKDDVMREASGMKITVAEAIKRECDILSQFCHPFICEFVHRFEDDDNIYLVMGVIRGMELWSVIHRQDDDGEWDSGIPEENAKFYGALIADTLRYMHRQKICYRDLKPENVMIDETGYPVFVDFGFAKNIPDGRTFTFCGTPNYTAPEIISNDGHGYPVDWWAFGVVVYEMVSGENPFYYEGIPEMQLLADITHNEPEPLGHEFSAEVMDLTSKLLIKDPLKRFGTSSANDILNHPWFESVDLSRGRDKLLDAPFLPPVSDDA